MQGMQDSGSRESRDQERSKTVEALEYFAITPTQNVPQTWQIHHLTNGTLRMLKFPGRSLNKIVSVKLSL